MLGEPTIKPSLANSKKQMLFLLKSDLIERTMPDKPNSPAHPHLPSIIVSFMGLLRRSSSYGGTSWTIFQSSFAHSHSRGRLPARGHVPIHNPQMASKDAPPSLKRATANSRIKFGTGGGWTQCHQDTVPLKTGTISNFPISKNRSLCPKSGFNFEYSKSTMYS